MILSSSRGHDGDGRCNAHTAHTSKALCTVAWMPGQRQRYCRLLCAMQLSPTPNAKNAVVPKPAPSEIYAEPRSLAPGATSATSVISGGGAESVGVQ
jgi:hypothetical protein